MIEGEVKNKTEFGLFLGLDGDVDGMVHLSDLDWKRPGEQVIEEYKKGDQVKAKVLDVDVEKERISLGVKQLEGDPLDTAGDLKKGVGRHLRGHRGEGGRPRREDRRHRSRPPSSSAPSSRATAASSGRSASRSARRSMRRVTQFDRRTRKVQVSIKALEVAEEKEAIAQYGSSDSGATLGDILGTALKRATRSRRQEGRE